MASETGARRRQLLLAALVVVMGVVIYALWPRGPALPASRASNSRGAARAAATGEQVEAPDVRLEALEAERPKPEGADRNLFRFRPPPAPPKPPAPPPSTVQQAPPPVPTAPPAPVVPPIPLKFIGVLTLPDGRKQAILSDDSRRVYYGVEGQEVDGRYKILRVGEESIDLAYLDGRGRQTLRLAGS